jgi:hypothetical protein
MMNQILTNLVFLGVLHWRARFLEFNTGEQRQAMLRVREMLQVTGRCFSYALCKISYIVTLTLERLRRMQTC